MPVDLPFLGLFLAAGLLGWLFGSHLSLPPVPVRLLLVSQGNPSVDSLTNDQTLPIQITAALDAKGARLPVPAGVPIWSVSDPTVAAIAADDATGLKATLTPLKDGSINVIAALNLPGSGVLSGQVAISVTAGAAVSLVLEAGTPTP